MSLLHTLIWRTLLTSWTIPNWTGAGSDSSKTRDVAVVRDHLARDHVHDLAPDLDAGHVPAQGILVVLDPAQGTVGATPCHLFIFLSWFTFIYMYNCLCSVIALRSVYTSRYNIGCSFFIISVIISSYVSIVTFAFIIFFVLRKLITGQDIKFNFCLNLNLICHSLSCKYAFVESVLYLIIQWKSKSFSAHYRKICCIRQMILRRKSQFEVLNTRF